MWETLLSSGASPLRRPVLLRVAQDLRQLEGLVSIDKLRHQFLTRLRQGESGAVDEVFALARVARWAGVLELGTSGRGFRRIDGALRFGMSPVALEVKRQTDDFPFKNGTELSPGIEVFSGSRPGSDPRFLDMPTPETTSSVPGSTIWRDALEEAAMQLPTDVPSLIAVSVDAFGFEDDIAAALFGDTIWESRRDPDSGWGTTSEVTLGNGVLAQDSFRHVAGVWFFRLRDSESGAGEPILCCDWARGVLNPRYVGAPLPDALTLALPSVCSDCPGDSHS